jgi:hypothetical protein
VKLVALQSLITVEVARVLGFLLPPKLSLHELAVSSGPVVFPRRRPPTISRSRVHPLMGFTSPSEYVLPGSRSTQVPCTSQGLPPIRDSSIRSPLFGGLPSPTFGSPSAFLTLSTIYSSKYLAGLFHPTATFGIRSSGVFPAAKPPCLIDKPSSHAACGIRLPASCPTGASSNRADFRVLIRAAIRCRQQAV